MLAKKLDQSKVMSGLVLHFYIITGLRINIAKKIVIVKDLPYYINK
jgi:hypothetical protein